MQSKYIFGFVLSILVVRLNAQTINTEFGKNRIQHHDDFKSWYVVQSANFKCYFYGKSRNVAHASILIAENEIEELERMIQYKVSDPIELIVYTDLSDMLQSNIGLEQVFETSNGKTKIVGPKIFVYFDGNHQHLKVRIREGIGQVYFNSMFTLGGFRELLDQEATFDLPQWFTEGFISFLGSYWDILIDDEFRELWNRQNPRYRKFDTLTKEHPRVAGHSFWYFIYLNYGEKAIQNLIYIMRLDKNLKKNVQIVLGKNFDELDDEWASFYESKYLTELPNIPKNIKLEEIKLKNKRYNPITSLRFSPNYNHLVYVVNDIGKSTVYLKNLKGGKDKKLLVNGYKNAVQETDYLYPQLAWNPTLPYLTIVYEKKDVIYLRKINTETFDIKEQPLPEDIQKVFSIDYIDDENYVLSALYQGFSDLVSYNSRGRFTKKITTDRHDDLDARMCELGGQKGVIFSSTRSDNEVAIKGLDSILDYSDFDLFFLPIQGNNWGSNMVSLTNTDNINERNPQIKNDKIFYSSDLNGLINLYSIDLSKNDDPQPISDVSRNIIQYDISHDDTQLLEAYEDGQFKVYITHPDSIKNNGILHYTPFYSTEKIQVNIPEIVPQIFLDEKYLFISKFPDSDNVEPLIDKNSFDITTLSVLDRYKNSALQSIKVVSPVEPINMALGSSSRLAFALNEFVFNADNSVLFEGLESYTSPNTLNQQQDVGLLAKVVFKDLFEDYKVQAGIRVPFDLSGSEYFVVFDNRKKLIDKRYAFYRKSKTDYAGSGFAVDYKLRTISYVGLARFSYPFSSYRSIRLTPSIRHDNNFLLLSDPTTSQERNFTFQRLSLKAEYIFDNTVVKGVNLLHGSRYKVYSEFINRFNLDLRKGSKVELSKANSILIGFDARHYEPIARHSIIALRLSAATAWGSERMLYLLGGTEGNIIPDFNNNLSVPTDINFAYQHNVGHLRGFQSNSRNGNSYFLFNSEFRFPLFRYLSRTEMRSRFLKNFQLVAFFDGGLAWHGLNPAGTDNPLNTQKITDTRLSITVNTHLNRLLFGFGPGIRFDFFGYYLRMDYAWGYDNYHIQKPKFYLSMGVDF